MGSQPDLSKLSTTPYMHQDGISSQMEGGSNEDKFQKSIIDSLGLDDEDLNFMDPSQENFDKYDQNL